MAGRSRHLRRERRGRGCSVVAHTDVAMASKEGEGVAAGRALLAAQRRLRLRGERG